MNERDSVQKVLEASERVREEAARAIASDEAIRARMDSLIERLDGLVRQRGRKK
jgi:hypothetical protein